LKAFGQGHLSLVPFFLSVLCGAIYTSASLRIISGGTITSLRFLLLTALLGLLVIKFIFVNEMLVNWSNTEAWCSFLAEVIPGLGKRSILLLALFGFRPLAVLSPSRVDEKKVKKD